MSKDYRPTNAGSFKIGDFVRYSKSFCAKFHWNKHLCELKGEVLKVAQLGTIMLCEVGWDNEPDFVHSVCFDNLEPWILEF